MKSKFGAGRDFAVLDPETGEQRYFVDGHMGTRPKAEVKDAAGKDLYSIRGSLLGIPKHMTISDAEGNEIAWLKAKFFSPIKTKMTLETSSGDPWSLEGEILEKNYSITSAGAPIVNITQKWVTVRDSYTLDVADGVDPGLALAVMWAVDRWVERD
jgi:uncharacterized protein YxjI